MHTWALYLDESGDPNKHLLPLPESGGATPIFTLAGVALPLVHWREYHAEYSALKLEFFGNEIAKSSKTHHQWELKGNRAIAPRNSASDRLAAFTHKTLDLAENHAGRLFSVSFIKNHTKPTSSTSMYTKALQILAEAFDIFLREKSDDARGLIILDSRLAHEQKGSGLDYQVAVSLLTYIFGNDQGRQLKRLQEAPLFADSTITSGIQIADVVAALMYAKSYRTAFDIKGKDAGQGYRDYTHIDRYNQHLEKLRFKSQNKYEGWYKNGFRLFDHRKDKGNDVDTEVKITA